MAAPTLRDYVESNYTDSGTSETSGAALDWSAAGDLVVALGMTEDNTRTLSTPAATGLTFAAMSGSPTNTSSSCKGYAWSATAAGSGSQTVTAATDGGAAKRGISVWAWGGSDGLGTPVVNVGTGKTVSVTVVGPDSTVVMILGDWDATSDVTFTTVPAGGTVREAVSNAGTATFIVIEWTNQAAGTRSYGVDTDWTGTGTITKLAVEVKGTGTSGATINAGVIAAVAALPTATKSTGSTVSPSAIAATTALPTATKQTGSTVSPGAVAAVATLPAAATGAGSTVTPAVVAATASLPSVEVQTGSTVSPAAVAALAALPAPSVQVGGSATVNASPISAVAALPAASARTGSTVSPSAIAAVAAVPDAVVQTGSGRVNARIGGVLVPTALHGAVRLDGVSNVFG